jgi:phosphoribosylaminoimidazolecarboxamide formyltransferase/IMP cyclohydrolase
MTDKKIKRALLSVFNKQGILELAKFLNNQKIEIISTGGTLRLLKENGIEANPICKYTEFPEILNGRVKTLHPKIFGGILQRDILQDIKEAREHNIPKIDLVVCNLYPFRQPLEFDEVKIDEALELIDIGGPSMLRAAAKNFKQVTVVCNPEDYPLIMEELEKKGGISLKTRIHLAQKVFSLMSSYEKEISSFFNRLKEKGYESACDR